MFNNALLSEPLKGHPFDPNICLIRPNNQNYTKPEYVAVFPWLLLHTYNKTYLKYALFTGNLFGIPREMGAVQIKPMFGNLINFCLVVEIKFP